MSSEIPTGAALSLFSGLPGRRGVILILSSPSGAGKTTIARLLLEEENEGEKRLEMSVSVTTRPRRPSEISGRDYEFIDEPSFQKLVREGALLEHAEVFGNWYGTPKAPVDRALSAGRDVLFDVDWQGTQQLDRAVRGDLVSIFILPPSMTELERRLRGRAQDSDAVIAGRMTKAAAEISHWREYDYVLVNNDVQVCLAQVRAILASERLRRSRQTALEPFVTNLLGA